MKILFFSFHFLFLVFSSLFFPSRCFFWIEFNFYPLLLLELSRFFFVFFGGIRFVPFACFPFPISSAIFSSLALSEFGPFPSPSHHSPFSFEFHYAPPVRFSHDRLFSSQFDQVSVVFFSSIEFS